jgi:L-lactate dehydrogenase complex protein LldF
MLLSLRHQAVEQNTQPGSMKLAMKSFAWAASKPLGYRALTSGARVWLRMLARGGWISKLPGPAGRWTSSRDLKAPAAKTFQEQWRALKNA